MEARAAMRVLILGATGSLGRHLLPQALEAGHDVTVLVRDPSKLPSGTRARIRAVQGDALNPGAVDRALRGQQAVIYSLGRPDHRTPTTFFSDSTRILLDAMQRNGVRRLVCVTGIGAGDSRGHGGLLYNRVIYPFITRRTYEDKTRQEDLIRQTVLDWIIVRPASFTDAPRMFLVRAYTHLPGITVRSISRADTAAFVIEQLTRDEYLRQAVLIGN